MNIAPRIAAVVCCAACALPAAAQVEYVPPPPVIATVGEFNVTPSYFNYTVQHRFAREIMEDIIRARVIEDEARRQGIRVTMGDVDAEVERRESDFARDEDFVAYIHELGFTEKGYREHLRTRLLLGRLIDRAAGVTDAEALAYYEAHSDEFEAKTQLHVMAIATETPQDAMVAYRAILDGTPFEVAARRFNTDPDLGTDGNLGWVTSATIPIRPLWHLAQAMTVGDTSEPVSLEDSFYIVRLVDRRAGEKLAFAAVRERIKARLREERGLTEADYVTSLLARANISINWEPVAHLEQEYEALRGIRVAVDGRVLRLDPAPFITTPEMTMLVPAKQVLDAVGARSTWRPEAKVLDITRAGTEVTVTIGEKALVVAGEFMDMKAPALLRDGIVFIPPREVLTALGLPVHWNQTTRLLSISTTHEVEVEAEG